MGEVVGDDRPVENYPPDERLAVDDPSIVGGGVIAPDDVARSISRTTAAMPASARSARTRIPQGAA